MLNQFEKALRIAKKTNDKIIIIDSSGNEKSMVIMPLDEYENILEGDKIDSNLTDEQMIDKINRDIVNSNFANTGNFVNEEIAADETEDDEMYYYNEADQEFEKTTEDFKKNIEENKNRNNWRIPNDIKNQAEEVVEDLPF